MAASFAEFGVRNLTLKRLISWFDLQNVANWRLYQIVLGAALFLLAFAVRVDLFTYREGDFYEFARWFNQLRDSGSGMFATDFSMYNAPILIIFWLLGHLPIGTTAALKGLTVAGDLLLASALGLLVRSFYPKSWWPAYLTVVLTMFLPVVLTTGPWWGQYDNLFTAFAVLSLFFLIQRKSVPTWIMFGIALSIKVQAVFFLPILLIASFRRIRLWHAIWALVSFVALSILPVFFGASIRQALGVYFLQSSLGSGRLTIYVPNIYVWYLAPEQIGQINTSWGYLHTVGLVIGLAIMIATLMFALYREKFGNEDILLAATFTSTALVMVLPMMHERYMYLPAFLALAWALCFPKISSISVAVTLQLTTVFSYAQYLSVWNIAEPPFGWSVLALANLIALITMGYKYISASDIPISVKRFRKFSINNHENANNFIESNTG